MCPGNFLPLKTLPGVDVGPIEPGLLWYIEPCPIGPLDCPWRLITPWKPLPFDVPWTSILSPAANTSAFNSSPTLTFSNESNLNSLKCFLGVTFAFAKCPLTGLLSFFSLISPKPNWTAS